MRYAILSDIHGNLAALDAVLTYVVGQVNQVWCLGDIVGYGPDPNECIARIRDLKAVCIAGNHDWGATGKASLGEFSNDAQVAMEWTIRELNEENIAYLTALPEKEFPIGNTLVHGSPRDPIWEYLTYSAAARANFTYFATNTCLVGHTHVPLIFQQAGNGPTQTVIPQEGWWVQPKGVRAIINPGSVGQPRDGDSRAAFLIYDTELGFEFRRITYPIKVTQNKIWKAGLPARLAIRLDYGS